MATYVMRNGVSVNKKTGEPMVQPDQRGGPICTPMIAGAMPEYRSPIDGRIIHDRAERRDDLKRNDCIEWDASMSPTKGRIKNAKFAAKHGMQVSEEFR